MNILILSWRGPKHPQAGGAELSTHEHAKAWVKAGHKVTLFTSFYEGARRQEIINGVKIIRKGRQIFGVQFEAFKWYLFDKHSKFDLVVDEFHGIPFFTPLYVRVKKLAWIHEVAKEVWRLNILPRPYNFLAGIMGTMCEPWIFKLIYAKTPFMTVSLSTKKDLVNWGIPPENTAVIENGVTLNIPQKLPRKEKAKTLIFLGALAKDKGIEDALKIFALVNNQDKDWQFWVVGHGAGEFLNHLKSTTKRLGIDKYLKFWGFVSEAQKFELLSRAHVLVNPSVREGWGLVNIEANSVGTPVLGYRVPGVKDSVLDGKTGYLCRPGDTKEMAQKVVKLLKNKSKYKKIQGEAVSWSKNFSWAKAGKRSLKLIETL